MPVARRARGIVLRIARVRPLAIGLGLALAAPAAWVEFIDRNPSWWAEGLGLVAGATGLALLWTGVAGLGPDWIDED